MLFGLSGRLAPSPGMNPASHQAPRVFDVRCTLTQSPEMTLRIIRVRALKGVKTPADLPARRSYLTQI